jgi:hypothetical protein
MGLISTLARFMTAEPRKCTTLPDRGTPRTGVRSGQPYIEVGTLPPPGQSNIIVRTPNPLPPPINVRDQ